VNTAPHSCRLLLAGVGACALAAVGCSDSGQIGSGEAFRVRDGQFFSGELPGKDPVENPADAEAPRITSLESANLDVFQGQGAKPFRGRASKDAYAVALALEGARGYWVVPVGALDPVADEYTWEASTDFDLSLEPGKHALRVVALDEQERAGTQLELDLCVRGRVVDNGSACSASRKPPRAVITLSWDNNADLDLQVVDAEGRVFDAKRSTSLGGDATTEEGESLPALDRDSNAGCVADGFRTENLVWNEQIPEGRYGIYVNLFDPCRQAAVRFRAAVYTPSEPDDDNSEEILVERYARSGVLLDSAVNPTSSRGLFAGEFTF
jgi:hypothetical protein